MTSQSNLFGDMYPDEHWTTPPSHYLADGNRLERQVHHFLLINGGATCDEVEVGLGLSHQTASARLSELEKKKKKVYRDGRRRRTRTGRFADVYCVRGATYD